VHWTYAAVSEGQDLEQGDIIAPSSELREILRTIHPHFHDDKYLSFMIATQSCDIVRRRGGVPKARYISITAVRSLKLMLPILLAEVVRPLADGAFPSSSKDLARQFLKRLLDQNEQSLGLFYLHPDADVGLGEPAVAFLRVKIALKSEHYDKLVAARRGGLKSEFRGKFGWLLGNLYSRAASPDWADVPGGDRQVASLIETYLEEQLPGFGPHWIDDELIEAGKAANFGFTDVLKPERRAQLEKLRPPSKLERLIGAVLDDAKQVFGSADEEQFKKLRNRLTNNGKVKKLLK
jgi:hypothetical protein